MKADQPISNLLQELGPHMQSRGPDGPEQLLTLALGDLILSCCRYSLDYLSRLGDQDEQFDQPLFYLTRPLGGRPDENLGDVVLTVCEDDSALCEVFRWNGFDIPSDKPLRHDEGLARSLLVTMVKRVKMFRPAEYTLDE